MEFTPLFLGTSNIVTASNMLQDECLTIDACIVRARTLLATDTPLAIALLYVAGAAIGNAASDVWFLAAAGLYEELTLCFRMNDEKRLEICEKPKIVVDDTEQLL